MTRPGLLTIKHVRIAQITSHQGLLQVTTWLVAQQTAPPSVHSATECQAPLTQLLVSEPQSQGLQFIIEALDPNNLADILHLAINRKYRLRDCSFEPQEILGHILQPINSAGHQALQEQMTPQLLSELMQTAIDHSHHAVVSSLCRFPAVNSLDAVTVQQMFLQVMRQHAERDFTYILGDMFTHLAAYLDSTTADELLLLAAQTKKASAMGWFAKLDVAKLISSRAIDAVVKTLSSGTSGC